MFVENKVNHDNHSGCIEVITGSMFSGKTEEMIRRLRRALIANQKIVVFKPNADTRNDSKLIVSHNNTSISAIPIETSNDIFDKYNNAKVIGIDEAQFFDKNLPEVCTKLAESGIRIIIAGLDMDFRGFPFGQMPYLLSKADYITKLHAICIKCGNPAQFTHRKNSDTHKVLIGEKDLYEPLCRPCFLKTNNKTNG